ncbi:MAG TPA: OsmC family protein [Symbiobacteriaceae bacterium]|nr:OsmC family protein [Symbiobacteriaceae bacterium]
MLSDSQQTFRVYGTWKGLPATEGDLSSSFSNLRLSFSAPVADGGQPGFTSPEEMLLGAAVSAYCTAFMQLAAQMALDVATLEVDGELVRAFDEVEGNRLQEIRLKPVAGLRTGLGFEKVHDMFRRAAALAQHRSPVLRALDAAIKIRIEADFGEAR